MADFFISRQTTFKSNAGLEQIIVKNKPEYSDSYLPAALQILTNLIQQLENRKFTKPIRPTQQNTGSLFVEVVSMVKAIVQGEWRLFVTIRGSIPTLHN